ncbi:LTA synthase family protein [Hymenobacter lutimineralis]|uniref:LTA synthase family protein n=1 Tax=Hymenobacter lutimineralis TaxID=2606448 RepID=A0A5D6UTG4_9BACT|nr:LTA synthase family protein [Hymenobacter lutimineralis]TYZ06235.1 LTA synthase family protein [Hymenobacter lutimineralis]
MKNRFAFQPRYFLFWLCFFFLAKLLFLAYQFRLVAPLSAATVANIFWYGLRLDASAAAYLCLPAFLLFLVDSLAGPRFPLQPLLRYITSVAVLVVTTLTIADLELYQVWGFRLDATPLQYLNTPAEMAASAGAAPWALLLALWAGLLAGSWGLYQRLIGRLPATPVAFGRWRALTVSVLYLALAVVPLRGGVQQIPVNQSDVYFSPVPFANHAAVNMAWNVMNSLLQQNSTVNPYPYLPDSTATRLVSQLYPAARPKVAPQQLLTTPRPNVLFIILESFTSKWVGSLGGQAGTTPTLDSLARTGVLFSNVYAAGDRSQKGLVALLSGYPNQPTTSIIKYPRKTERLPHLARSLAAVGYSSRYYHGGELAFANMKSYLVAAGYNQLTERSDFRAAEQNSKWGAHDHVLFRRMLSELPAQRQPFFVTAFTLSSHEPFDVPMATRFRGSDETTRFRNSVYYTDHALGQFLRAAQEQPWWANTLVVLVADHGHPLPGGTPNYAPAKFRIPLILTGGALRAEARGQVVATLGSQTDVAATLLAQLALPTAAYPFSRNLLAADSTSAFAFYCFTDGFGFVTPRGVVTFDNAARQVISRSPGVPAAQLQLGKAYQQVTFEDFLRK